MLNSNSIAPIYKVSYVAGTVLCASQISVHLIPIATLHGWYNYPHFTNEEIESRSQMMHLKSYMKLEAFLLKEKKMASHILHTCPLDEQYTYMP